MKNLTTRSFVLARKRVTATKMIDIFTVRIDLNKFPDKSYLLILVNY